MARAFAADGFRYMLGVLASLTRQNGRTPETIQNAGNSRERRIGITLRPLQIARKLGPQMADQPERDGTGQGGGCSLSFNMLNAVIRDAIGCHRARRIEEDIVLSRVSRRIHTKCE